MIHDLEEMIRELINITLACCTLSVPDSGFFISMGIKDKFKFI